MKIKWKKIIQFKWFRRLYVLYIFGFIVNFRPPLPFFYEFLRTDKNFTEDEVAQDILPVFFYSTAVLLLPVFFLMEFLKYNPFIIISTLTGIVSTCLYIWTESLVELQVAQAFYGCMTAAEVAYYVSVYAHGDIKTYQKLTACVRAAPLVARLFSTFFGQLLVSVAYLSYEKLHYFNLSSFIIATILNIFLPPIGNQNAENSEKVEENQTKITSIFSNLAQAFPNKYVIKWSVWSIFTICGYNQFSIYVQPLWQYIQKSNGTFVYNGVLEGVYTIFALTGTILGGFANFDWKFKGDLILSMTSLVEAFMLIFMSQITNYLALNCMFYVILGFMYHFIMTVLSAEIAKFLKKGCFGLVFGVIALLGWGLSSGMVCLFNDRVGIEVRDYQDLLMWYGFYHLGISVAFMMVGLTYWFAKHTYQ
ncbi:hypothetical protein Zmor_015249 [Zophobas morio]|uniref:Thiamine transporter 2 n=1 Tax=Zophobas morio TaxID=2755281 RepID=A0AA38MH24_9CUCU|nr:hypothetical protein Zmor_015249 [Zophobas morio]